jgi:hypothetical protein
MSDSIPFLGQGQNSLESELEQEAVHPIRLLLENDGNKNRTDIQDLELACHRVTCHIANILVAGTSGEIRNGRWPTLDEPLFAGYRIRGNMHKAQAEGAWHGGFCWANSRKGRIGRLWEGPSAVAGCVAGETGQS